MVAESDLLVLSVDRHDFKYIFRDRPEIIDSMLHISKSRKEGCYDIINKNNVLSELSPG